MATAGIGGTDMDRREVLKVGEATVLLPVLPDDFEVEVAEAHREYTPLILLVRHPEGSIVAPDGSSIPFHEVARQIAEGLTQCIKENTGYRLAAAVLPPGFDIEVVQERLAHSLKEPDG